VGQLATIVDFGSWRYRVKKVFAESNRFSEMLVDHPAMKRATSSVCGGKGGDARRTQKRFHENASDRRSFVNDLLAALPAFRGRTDLLAGRADAG
jgi:hypothetical protein